MRFIWPNKPIHIYNPWKLMGVLKPLSAWVVQPKWNGKRVEIACDEKGNITLYGRQGQKFPERWPWLSDIPLERPWFVDGELLRDKRIFVWDFALLGGKSVFKEPYESRLAHLVEKLPKALTQDGQTVQCVETLPATSYEALLGREGDPFLEGIVWKNRAATDLWGVHSTSQVSSCFKFRFAECNPNGT